MTRQQFFTAAQRLGAVMLAFCVASAIVIATLLIAVGVGELQRTAQDRTRNTERFAEESKPKVPPEINVALSSPKTVAPAGFETRYAGTASIDEQYLCQATEPTSNTDAGHFLDRDIYVWLKTATNPTDAKYILSRDPDFKLTIMLTQDSHWLRVEGGNARHMCLDVFSLPRGENKGKSGCKIAFNREFPEIAVYSNDGKPQARSICKALRSLS